MVVREINDCKYRWFANLPFEAGFIEWRAALYLRDDEKFKHATLDVGYFRLLRKRTNDSVRENVPATSLVPVKVILPDSGDYEAEIRTSMERTTPKSLII